MKKKRDEKKARLLCELETNDLHIKLICLYIPTCVKISR